jgi:hypothetical protein
MVGIRPPAEMPRRGRFPGSHGPAPRMPAKACQKVTKAAVATALESGRDGHVRDQKDDRPSSRSRSARQLGVDEQQINDVLAPPDRSPLSWAWAHAGPARSRHRAARLTFYQPTAPTLPWLDGPCDPGNPCAGQAARRLGRPGRPGSMVHGILGIMPAKRRSVVGSPRSPWLDGPWDPGNPCPGKRRSVVGDATVALAR